jgi:multiple sugar transport system permease protein/putative spermidine/putrescine transport system permease protein
MNPVWAIRSPTGRWALGIAIVCLAALLFALPIATAVLWSLVDPEVGWFPPDVVPASLSLANVRHMLAVPELLDAAGRSLTVAVLVTLLCSGLGLPTGFALGRDRTGSLRAVEVLVLTPLLMPGIVLAVGLGAIFIRLGLAQTVAGVVLVQTAVVLPLTIRIVAATARAIPADLLDAARNLGAAPHAVARHVALPLLLPGVLAAALLSFVGSLEEFLLSFVVGMPKVQTLPMLLWAYLGGRSAILSYAAVVTLFLLVPTLAVLVVVERFLKQEYLAAGFGKA